MNIKQLSLTAALAALTCLAGMTSHFATGALVPFSILPLMVFLTGIILEPAYAALTMLVYLILGMSGLPVFSNPPFGGLGYIFKPTFGYLMGYIPAAYVTSKIYNKKGLLRAFVGVLGGLVVLYTLGLGYLYGMLRWALNAPQSVMGVIAMGFTPFILFDLIKAGIAALIGNNVVKRREQHGSSV